MSLQLCKVSFHSAVSLTFLSGAVCLWDSWNISYKTNYWLLSACAAALACSFVCVHLFELSYVEMGTLQHKSNSICQSNQSSAGLGVFVSHWFYTIALRKFKCLHQIIIVMWCLSVVLEFFRVAHCVLVGFSTRAEWIMKELINWPKKPPNQTETKV